ncbi:MAG: ABC transporter permease [Acidimicrobiales bacterium]
MLEPSLSVQVADEALVRVNAPQRFFRGFIPAVRDVWAFRELLVNLVRQQLKVKYKDSILGFLWSLARPMFLLAIYYVVFGIILKNGFPHFAFYLFSGLIAWDLFGTTLGAATTSIVGSAGLIKKVYFPREILPLATVGAGLFHFVLQLVVLFATLLVFRYDFFGPNLALLPIALVALILFMTACSLFLAAVNVYLRDTQHLLEVILLFWFWMNPIVYSVGTMSASFGRHSFLGVKVSSLYFLNPMADIVITFQRAIYKHVTVHGLKVLAYAGYAPYLKRVLVVLAVSVALVWLAQRIFARAQGNFAQEL